MAPKVLVSDELSETAVQIFRDRGVEVAGRCRGLLARLADRLCRRKRAVPLHVGRLLDDPRDVGHWLVIDIAAAGQQMLAVIVARNNSLANTGISGISDADMVTSITAFVDIMTGI